MKWESKYYNKAAFVWITILTDKYCNPLLEKLIKKGYSVSSADPDGVLSLSLNNSVSSVMGIMLISEKEIKDPSFITKDIRDSLNNIKALYYSIVTMVNDQVAWSPGNIVFEYENNTIKQKPNLRLIKNDISSNKDNV